MLKSFKNSLKLSNDVDNAIKNSLPIVALESTIITHGMPYPDNYRTALKVENIIRKNGAIPATIAIIDGTIRVGLDDNCLRKLSQNSEKLIKISRRDLPIAIAQALSGGTTVSATMLIASKVGIKIFATGGIGGVHRDVINSWDISTDLTELGRTPVAVFSSGVKSILDIEKTLEFLETQGVTVCTFNYDCEKSVDFPAFWSRKSGHKSTHTVNNLTDIAQIIKAHSDLKLQNGLLFAVPIPLKDEIPHQVIEPCISQALQDVKTNQIIGKEVTPYLLSKVNQLTQGKSLQSNISLICNNANCASKVAVLLSSLDKNLSHLKLNQFHQRPIVVGASVADHLAQSDTKQLTFGGLTHPGSVKILPGGVGRNVADCLARLGHDPLFITVIGDDLMGHFIRQNSQHMDRSGMILIEKSATASIFVLVDGNGEVKCQVGDIRILKRFDHEKMQPYMSAIKAASIVVVDLNLPIDVCQLIMETCGSLYIPVWLETADPSQVDKFRKIPEDIRKFITFASPNLEEFIGMIGFEVASKLDILTDDMRVNHENIIKSINFHKDNIMSQLAVQNLIITLGSKGLLLVINVDLDSRPILGAHMTNVINKTNEVQVVHIPASNIDRNHIVNESGAGDCFVGGTIGGLLRGLTYRQSMEIGLESARISLAHGECVPRELSQLSVPSPKL